jgi:hypothetical protein
LLTPAAERGRSITPQNDLLPDTLTEAISHANQGDNILIHCSAGLGRTALFATLLARLGHRFHAFKLFAVQTVSVATSTLRCAWWYASWCAA